MKKLISFLGIESEQITHSEKLVSALGGFTGILLIITISHYFVGSSGAAYIVPSMGASAVLLFAVPHGKLSQPWALFGGHTVSALIGVSCYLLVPNMFAAAALAVGIAIGVMHYLNCIHPPGGATALAAVIGGSQVHELGYLFTITPVMLNVLVIFATAFLFNAMFHWRRYPASLISYIEKPVHNQAGAMDFSTVTQSDLDFAMKKMNLLLDVTGEDLIKLYALASKHAQSQHLQAEQIYLDHYYSNGLYGKHWAVRHIIDESQHSDPTKDMVIYKIVAGPGRRRTDSCTREEFAAWARHEVQRNETSWQRSNLENQEQK